MKKRNPKYKSGFSTPPLYFERFEDRLLEKLKKNKLPNNTGFKVPDTYFDKLEEKIINLTINAADDSKVISIFSPRNIRYLIAVAAMITLIIAVNTFNSYKTNSFNGIKTASITEYIDDSQIAINDSDVEPLLLDGDIVQLQIENQELSSEEIEEYLLEYLDDTAILIE